MYSLDLFKDGCEHKVIISKELLLTLAEHVAADNFSKVAILTDEKIATLWLPEVSTALNPIKACNIIIPAGEFSKSVSTLEQIWLELHRAKLDRHSLIICLGGGSLLDVGAFAASTYMRGIALIHIPTTLLAQVDASIGGKTAINLRGVKNLIGTFYTPKKVLIDPVFLSTLPARELISGSAEALKHALLEGGSHLEDIKTWDPLKTTNGNYLSILKRSCQYKLNIVRRDLNEAGLRKLLNFGHSAGHAFEALSFDTAQSSLNHGEAVAIGMYFESILANLSGLLSSSDLIFIHSLITHFNLPTKALFSVSAAQFLKLIESDKKNRNGSMKWTLLRAPGAPVYDVSVPEEMVVQALKEVCKGPSLKN
jgi:3-dehydroquinate synthase